MNREEIIEQQNAYYMAGYPSRRSENKMNREEIEKDVRQYLRQNFGSDSYSDVEMITGYVESRENHIEILKNENAELKDDNKVMADNYSKMEQKFYNQLAKAKEGLKWFVWYFREGCLNHVPYKHNVEVVEQFLNEVENPNTDISTIKSLTERQRLQIEALEGQTPWKDIKDKSEVIEKLTQAKEIIKNLIDDLTAIDGEEVKELGTVKEAEQFIKD